MPAHIYHNAHLRELHRNLSLHFSGAARQIEKLSSGDRVNRSSDDPASLALADGIEAEVRALAEGGRNVQQSVQMLQVIDGALDEISSMVQRMRELSAQAGSSTYNPFDRTSIDQEFQALREEIDRIARFTTYNGISLLDSDKEFSIQAGPLETGNDVSRLEIGDMRASGPVLDLGGLSIDTIEGAREALDRLKAAQEKIVGERNKVAAFQNRLELSAETTARVVEKMMNSEGEIRGADLARSVSELSKSQIMTQTAARFALEADADIDRILSLLQ